ncbi:MAG TPA: alpha-amylase family glycosyl hydrolase [Solirubrobacteraceae bacterium]
MPWWRDAVLYQIYPRSFQDSNGDGIGDLPGIVSRLDHLEWLGVDGIWLNPTMPSPNADWGYDVADYCDVHPDYGTLADLDRLVGEAGRRGIRVLLDLVPNHTSDRHPWFAESRRSAASSKRDWYVWADRPNNWRSAFGGPAWTLDERTGQYYLHNFLAEQPDLNWWSQGVRDAFDDVLRFWFQRGIAGFRIDVAHAIVKDRQLRDDPPVIDSAHPVERREKLARVHSMNRPETHDVLRRWRSLAERYDPPRLLLGETYVMDVRRLATYYGADADELQLAFNFPFVHASLDPAELAPLVAEAESHLPESAWPVWTGSNHDAGRFATRWCRGDERLVRCALVLLLCLRGTAVLYYGDEIGLPQTPLRREDLRDPVGIRRWPEDEGRDGGRTPMHWSREEGAGFTAPGVRPWLPLGDVAACNVADQRDDPGSTLAFSRRLIALRRELPELREGAYARVDAPHGVWAWTRGQTVGVALNLGRRRAKLPFRGRLLLSTAGDEAALPPRSAAIVALA